MAKSYFNRYVWLIDTIQRHGHISRMELNRLWEESPLNETHEELYERTFHNHRQAILEIFGIDIKYDRSLGYYISNESDIGSEGLRQWLLESIQVNNIVNETADMRDRILFEEIPSSGKWLTTLVKALRDRKCVQLTHQGFNRPEPATFTVHPYCLKLFRQRWYLLSRSEGKDVPYLHALDRILDVEILNKKAKVPASFDAEAFFEDYYGIIVGSDHPRDIVKIRVEADQVKYFDSLPLHFTQEKVEETDTYSVYRYYLIPTYDFRQEILSRGRKVTVLEPEWFRQEVKEEVEAMVKNY